MSVQDAEATLELAAEHGDDAEVRSTPLHYAGLTSALISLSNVTPEPTVEYLLSDMPRCPGMEGREAFSFDWPDMENAREKLADYHWGYYRCAVTQPELSAMYRENMVKPLSVLRGESRRAH